jgi:FKBP-type peptidyl-prolyl cis-trans isomerase
MKKILLATFFLAMTGLALAQTTKPKPATKPVATKPAAPKPALKTLVDSASYAIGVSVASFYKEQGITKLNTTLVAAAINDILSGKQPMLNEFTSNSVMNKLMGQLQEKKTKPAIDSGNAFLQRNKKRPEVKTTASGLQYEVIKEGTGVKPTAADTFVVHYRGTLMNGTEFDASYNRGQPLIMPVSQVIRGWTEGLQLMAVGSKYKFWIPYDLAYGTFDNGAIPGGSMLIFEVEMLDVKKAQ